MRLLICFFLFSVCQYAGDFQDAVNIRAEYRRLLASLKKLEERFHEAPDEYRNDLTNLRRAVSYHDGLYARQLQILKRRFLNAGSKQLKKSFPNKIDWRRRAALLSISNCRKALEF